MDPISLSSFGIAGVLYITLQISVTIHILLHKEEVHSAIGWIGLIWLTPLLGTVLYVILGINRIHRKALSLRNTGPNLLTASSQITDEEKRHVPPSFIQLLRLGHKVHPQHFAIGNTITPYINGDNAYPEMCRMIESAQKEVLISSYIFNNDKAGHMILSAAQTAVKNGAKVKILVDGVGLNYSKPNLAHAVKKLKGIEFSVFLPSKSPVTLPFVNLRNHRKIMIVDGKEAFFGGMNIAQGNLVAQHPKEPIQDTTFKVQGPVVAQMQRVFEEDWIFSGKKHFIPYTAPKNTPLPGHTPARIIPDGPDSDFGKIQTLVMGALVCAQNSIHIVTPYFLPERDVLNALELASMRGVHVGIILPSKSNIFGMDWAMRANFPRLLKKGVKIYLTPPPFDHSKLLVVDEAWTFAGSANWDVRSFRLNFECNIECLGRHTASQVLKIIHAKKQAARAEVFNPKQRPSIFALIRNNAFKLLTPYY